MLGITYHNPATITVFLDRMRFKDCFISTAELRDEAWKRKVKQFIDLPNDGRARVLFVESFATLRTLLQAGMSLDTVKVAVYDDCEVLAKVPGATIVDAHINGGETDTWQLYTVSFDEFNDALDAQPEGVPSLLRDHEVKDDEDLPSDAPVKTPVETPAEDGDDDESDDTSKDRSVLVMEQILDDIEAPKDGDDEDEEEEEVTVVEDPRVQPAAVALPELDQGRRILIKKRQPGEVEPEPESEPEESEPPPEPEAAPEVDPQPEPEPEPEPAVESDTKKKRKRAKKAPLESYELF